MSKIMLIYYNIIHIIHVLTVIFFSSTTATVKAFLSDYERTSTPRRPSSPNKYREHLLTYRYASQNRTPHRARSRDDKAAFNMSAEYTINNCQKYTRSAALRDI